MGGDHAGKGSGQHQNQQPRDALLGVGPHAGAKVGGGIVIRENSSHLLHILGALVGQNVNSIVDGDDTHEHALVVQNGHGGKVVALHLTGHKLLIVGDLHGDQIVLHDLRDGGLGVCQQQIAGRDNALQPVALHHIAGVDGLGILALLADGGKGLFHRHIHAQTHIFRGHQAAGRAFRVVQQLVQALAGLPGGFFQHPLDHACGHIFQQVGGIVQAHLLDGAHQLHVRESVHQIVPGFVGHIGKGFGGNFLFQQAEYHQTVVLVQLFQQLGKVGGLLFLSHLAQLDVLLFDQQLQQTALGQHLGVCLDLFVIGFLPLCLPHILLQVLGGFLVQILRQLLTHLGGDIGGQLLHRQVLFRVGFQLLFFHIHGLPPLGTIRHGGLSPRRRMQQVGKQKTRRPVPECRKCSRFRARKAAPFLFRGLLSRRGQKGERSTFCCPIYRIGGATSTMIRVHCPAFTSQFS